MKRVLIALVILALVAGGGVMVCRLLSRQSDRMLVALKTLEDLYVSGKTEQCRKQAETLAEQFETDTAWFPFLLRHETVHGIEESIKQLPILTETEDHTLFLAEIIRCRALVEEMYSTELPLPENIF